MIFEELISLNVSRVLEDLTGFLESIVFSSEDTDFTVARLKAPRFHDLVTIMGILPGIQPGERLSCRGAWKHHSQYGRQFEIENYHLKAPVDEVGIEKYLASGLIKRIGPVYAKRIVQEFGKKTMQDVCVARLQSLHEPIQLNFLSKYKLPPILPIHSISRINTPIASIADDNVFLTKQKLVLPSSVVGSI